VRWVLTQGVHLLVTLGTFLLTLYLFLIVPVRRCGHWCYWGLLGAADGQLWR
jgi:hypothetical protein